MGLIPTFDVMVGVSTAQNTANAVPALQLHVPKVLLVETDHAISSKWSLGITEVLSKRGLSVLEPLKLTEEKSSRIDFINERLTERIKNYPAVLFNIGGGQKAQQIALWDVFVARNNANDRVAYANLENGKLEVWSRINEKLSYEIVDLDSPLRVAEILTIFGKSIYSFDHRPVDFNGELYRLYQEGPLKIIIHGNRKKSKIENIEDARLTKKELTYSFLWRNRLEIESLLKKHLYEADDAKKEAAFSQLVKTVLMRIKQSALKDFFEYPETHEELEAFTSLLKANFKSDKGGFQNWIEKIFFDSLTNFKSEVNTDLKEIIPINRDKYKLLPSGNIPFKDLMAQLKLQGGIGFLFEEIVFDWLSNIEPELKFGFVEVLKNVKLSGGEKSGTTDAEHDFLLATKKGTLVSLDAKIGELPQKDLDARLLNLLQGGGSYAKFCIVLPLDQELYNQGLVQHHLLNTIFKLYSRIPILGLGFKNDPSLLNPATNQHIMLPTPQSFFKNLC